VLLDDDSQITKDLARTSAALRKLTKAREVVKREKCGPGCYLEVARDGRAVAIALAPEFFATSLGSKAS
jgi:hypothetical protein